MAVPLDYNIRSAMQRWTSSLVAIVGIAGTVAVFIAMLALARGFRATLVSSGLPQNAIVQQSGADSEMTSVIAIDALRVVEDAPQVARRGAEPLVSAEVVVIANLPLREGTGDGASYREAFLAYAAYFGTYTVDATKGTVTHHVEGSLIADYTGTDQVRPFRIEGDRLIIEIRVS